MGEAERRRACPHQPHGRGSALDDEAFSLPLGRNVSLAPHFKEEAQGRLVCTRRLCLGPGTAKLKCSSSPPSSMPFQEPLSAGRGSRPLGTGLPPSTDQE